MAKGAFLVCLAVLCGYAYYEAVTTPVSEQGLGEDNAAAGGVAYPQETTNAEFATHEARELALDEASAQKKKKKKKTKHGRLRKKQVKHPGHLLRQRTLLGCACKFPFTFGGETFHACTDKGGGVGTVQAGGAAMGQGTPAMWCDTGPKLPGAGGGCGRPYDSVDRAFTERACCYDVCVDGAGGKTFGAQSVWQQAMLEAAEEAEQRAAEAADVASARANLDSLKAEHGLLTPKDLVAWATLLTRKDLAAGADIKSDHDLADM